MAGGSGTRFWPKSRRRHPKQFLEIGGNDSLIAQTAERVAAIVGWDRLIVVTGKEHAEHALSELPGLMEHNLLVEPVGRNTAPCIAWANSVIRHRSPHARVAVLPADHFIGDVAGFRTFLDAAFSAVSDRILLFGMVPTHPETGYGYIEKGDRVGETKGKPIHAVRRFVEKPDQQTAEHYFDSGKFLWNSGMFVFPVEAMSEEIAIHLPELKEKIAELEASPKEIARIYPTMPGISIDYGIMEKSERSAVIPAAFAWSDIGSWDAATEVYVPDELDNVVIGHAVLHQSQRAFVDSSAGRMVAVIGCEDIIVVDTPDAVLVVKRGCSQEVKAVVHALQKSGRDDLL